MTEPYKEWYEEPGVKCPECDKPLKVEHIDQGESSEMVGIHCKACGTMLSDYYVGDAD